jgi:hypothetical protein
MPAAAGEPCPYACREHAAGEEKARVVVIRPEGLRCGQSRWTQSRRRLRA